MIRVKDQFRVRLSGNEVLLKVQLAKPTIDIMIERKNQVNPSPVAQTSPTNIDIQLLNVR
jgi:hypothetical protein